jgi:hypothetical protein
MYVMTLPISGGGFVVQLAIIQHLCEAEMIPDLCLASSGGNVAAYIASGADWKWNHIERIARELSKDFFAKPWSSFSSLSGMIGYFKGDAYNKGTGISTFLKDVFTKDSITKYEIWTGMYNKTKQKARLVCNKSEKDSIIKFSSLDDELTQSMNPIYADGDIDLIGLSSVASASIPAFVPAQKILGELYLDGGLASSSPLVLIKGPLVDYCNKNNLPIHIIYINSIDLSCSGNKDGNNVIDSCRQAANNLIKSQTVLDRLAAYDILKYQNGTINKEEFDCNVDTLNIVKEKQKTCKSSLLEIFPSEKISIDIVRFSGDEVIEAMKEAYKKCKCRFWFVK